MEIKTVTEKVISGISIRTNNANEMNPETASIAGLYQDFDNNIAVDYENGARVYGVYYDYESDASGDFSVLAGADRIKSSIIELEQVTIQAGNYLLFKGEAEEQGEMPQAVIATWMKVWNYFSNADCAHQRAYKTDFEHYISATNVHIYIGIS